MSSGAEVVFENSEEVRSAVDFLLDREFRFAVVGPRRIAMGESAAALLLNDILHRKDRGTGKWTLTIDVLEAVRALRMGGTVGGKPTVTHRN